MIPILNNIVWLNCYENVKFPLKKFNFNNTKSNLNKLLFTEGAAGARYVYQ